MDAVGHINTSEPPQNEDALVDAVPLCRVCLMTNLVMRDLFLENGLTTLSSKAMSFANVKMSPDDGLPSHICCVCAEKLESAYDFKLQVEQADSVLREKFDSLNIKGELFFNDVEVHLHNVNRAGNNSELMEEANYVHTEESIEEMERNSQTGLLKDHLALLQVEKIGEQTEEMLHEDQVVEQALHKNYAKVEEMAESSGLSQDFIPLEPSEVNHEPIKDPQNSLLLTDTSEEKSQNESVCEPNTVVLPEEKDFEMTPDFGEAQVADEAAPEPEAKSEHQSADSEHDSDEDNYFENLNLSSRLKTFKTEKNDKVFFVCYLCDKQFVSKDVLKEHMHSHEEIRIAMKKTVDKTPKTAPPKTPPSGKRANKCPHCGKEYLYVISFNKHLKQHERDSKEKMPLEVSFQEDEDSMRFFEDNFECSGSEAEDESHACDRCAEVLPSKRALQKHKVKHIVLKCNVCEEDFETLEKLREHRAKHIVEGVLTEEDLKEEFQGAPPADKEQEVSEVAGGKSLKCPHCPMAFARRKPFERHVEAHEAAQLECKICHEKFGRKDLLKKHMELHIKSKTFKCTQCNKTFGSELTLRNHLIATNHKTVISGEEYDPNKRIKRVAAKAAQKIIDRIKTENEEDEFEEDVQYVTEEPQETDESYAPSSKEEQKMTGKKQTGKKSLDCTTCNKKCISKHALMKHMELHVKEEKNDKTEKIEKTVQATQSLEQREPEKIETKTAVNLDDDDADDTDDFESGLDWPMDNHECPTCKKRYSTKKSLLRHQLLHEEPNFECDICNVKFYRKDKLKAHYDKCSERNPDQVRKCNICGDTFENNEMLKQHRGKHVSEGILTEEDLREIEPRSDERKPGEKVARKRRTDIVGLECTECNKQYTSRKGLLRHIQVHEGKKYLCDICPKKFYRREHLKIHVAKHNMIKPYKCTRCTKRFIKEEQLNNHLSKHDRSFKKNKETDSTKRFLCEICSKSFTQSTTLIAHLRAHNGIKPYVCEVCSRPFTTNAYLKMHMRTHTQERPYICQYCSRAFARADTLANHLTSHTGEAKYHCKYCPKNFRRLKSLKEHIFIHTGQRPYACPTCDRRFNNNGSRYAHSKRCKQNQLQNQNRAQTNLVQVQAIPQTQQQTQVQIQQQQLQVQPQQQQQQQLPRIQPLAQAQLIKSQNIKTITIARPADQIGAQHQVMQHQEILMPLILPLTVTLADVGEEVILPEGTKIFTTT